MTDLLQRIQGLSDEEATDLLRRVAGALGGAPQTPMLVQQGAMELASRLSLPAESPTESPPNLPPGELARGALRLLAADDRYAPHIAAMLDSGGGRFTPGAAVVLEADLLALLQTQVPEFKGEATVSMPPAVANQNGMFRLLARQLLGRLGLQPTSMQSDAEYRIWFATSRRPANAADLSQGFGPERDSRIHFGSCRVFVPRSHQVGSTGSGWWARSLLGSDDRLKILSIDPLLEDAYWLQVRQQIADRAHDDRDAVVFIHGYNVCFHEAALRAAQIGFDLQIRGAMALYSWASRGEVERYNADEATIELDEQPLASFLCDMASRSGARKVHIIAHSMGNRAALRAMDRITLQAQRRSGVRFGQVILAAADVDARKFLELCTAYPQLSDRTTLYVSTRDLAVEASRWLHDFPRAGLMPPVTVAPGIDTVNATNTDLTLLGHGYVAEARAVISDIHALIRHDTAPDLRFGLRQTTTPDGDPYWLIGA